MITGACYLAIQMADCYSSNEASSKVLVEEKIRYDQRTIGELSIVLITGIVHQTFQIILYIMFFSH